MLQNASLKLLFNVFLLSIHVSIIHLPLQCPCLPEGLVESVSVDMAPVLQVDTKAVVALVGQQVEVLVAQPVFSSWFTEAITVLRPTAVKTDQAISPTLKHCPAPTWCTHRYTHVCKNRYINMHKATHLGLCN